MDVWTIGREEVSAGSVLCGGFFTPTARAYPAVTLRVLSKAGELVRVS